MNFSYLVHKLKRSNFTYTIYPYIIFNNSYMDVKGYNDEQENK